MWDPPEGYNPTQAMDTLQKKVELLSGRSLGAWSIDCETLQSTPALSAGGPQKLIHMLHNTEYPITTFAVLDSMTCIVAESSLDAIFMNLRHFYAPSVKKGQKIEVKGYHFELKDYLVKFGSIAIGSTNRGIVVEVEDTANEMVPKCWEPLTEFVKGLLDYSSDNIVPPHFSSVSNRQYRASDRMIHYAHIFTQLRKPGMVSGIAGTPTK